MIKKIALFALKLISFLIVFAVLFGVFQRILIPKYVEGSTISTANIDTFYSLEKNSIDVLFLGPSQLFCSVNAKLLNEKYGIKAFDFAASAQNLKTTVYYLKEALKTQKPRLVMVEISSIYWEKQSYTEEQNLAWNYTANNISKEKISSLYEISDGDLSTVFNYSIPLIKFHSRWGQLNKNDFHYEYDKSLLGYAPIDKTNPVSLNGFEDTEKQVVPDYSAEPIKELAELCSENGVEIVFFKSPVAAWTKGDSEGVKTIMKQFDFTFIDFNDFNDEIGLDEKKDFFNKSHLNSSGAFKFSKYLVQFLK